MGTIQINERIALMMNVATLAGFNDKPILALLRANNESEVVEVLEDMAVKGQITDQEGAVFLSEYLTATADDFFGK